MAASVTSPRGRALRALALLFASLGVILLAAYLLRGVLLAPWLTARIEREVESRTGVGIEIGTLGGSWVGGLEVRGVRTVREGVSGPLARVEVDLLRVRYSLPALLRGVEAFAAGARVELDGARLAVNLAPPPGGGAVESSRAPASPAPTLPGFLPALRIRGLDLVAERPGLTVAVAGLAAETRGAAAGPPAEIALEASSVTVRAPGAVLGPVPLAATVRPAPSGAGAEISIPGRGVTGEAAYEGGAVEAVLAFDAVALGEEGGLLTLPGGVVSGTLSGEVRVRAGAGRSPGGSCDLRLTAARVRGIPLERLSLRASLEGEQLRVEALEAVAGPNRVGASGLLLPLAALRGGADPRAALRAAAGTFSARLGDLPALLALAGRPLALAGPAPRHRLELEGTVGAGTFTLSSGSLALARGGVRLERLQAELPPDGAPWSAARVDAAVAVDLPDLSLLNRIAPLPALSGSLAAAVTLDGTVAGLSGTVRARAQGLGVGERALGDLDLEAAADGERVRVTRAALTQAAGANSLEARDVSLPVAPLAGRRWRELLAEASGAFTARLEDLPALAALAGRPLGLSRPVPAHRLEVGGSLRGGSLELSSGRLALERGSARVERLRAELPPEGAPWSAARVEAVLEIDLPELSLLGAVLSVPGLAGSLRGKVEFAGTAAEPAGVLRLAGRGLAAGDRTLGDLDLAATADRARVRVGEARLAHAAGANLLRLEGVALAASDLAGGRWRELLAGASGSFDADLRDVPALAGLSGRAVPPGGPAVPEHRLRLAGRIDAGAVELASAELVAAGATVRASRARLLLPPSGRPWGEAAVELAVEADVPDLAVLAELLSLPPARGRLRAEAEAAGPLRGPEGRFSLELEAGEVGGVGIALARVRGRLAGESVEIAELEVATVHGRLALAGSLVRTGGREALLSLSSLTLARGAEEARLLRPARLRALDSGDILVEDLRLEGPGGAFGLDGRISPRGESDFSFDAAGLGTGGWLRGLAGDRVAARGVDLSGSVTGRRERPAVRLAGTVAALEGAGTPAPLSGRFELSWSAGILTVAAFEWSDGNGARFDASGRLPLDPLADRPLLPGALELAVRAQVPDLRSVAFLLPDRLSATGALAADLDLRGTWEQPAGELSLELGEVRISGLPELGEQGPLTLALTSALGGGDVELRGLSVSSSWLTAEASGSWSGAPSLAQLLRGEAFPGGGSLRARGTFAVPELSRFRRLAGNPRRLSGSLGGEFSLAGPPADPSVEATVRLADGAVAYGGGLPPVERLAATVLFRGRSARLEQAGGELGGAPFRLEGSATWGAEAPGVDLRLAGKNLLLFRNENLLARADVDLRAQGPLARLRLAGSVLLDNSSFSRTLTLRDLFGEGGGGRKAPRPAGAPLFSLETAPWSELAFDLRVGAKSPLVIRSNLARGALRPDLTLRGTGLRPVLAGNVFVDPSRIRLPGGTMRVDRGIVTFPAQGVGAPSLDLAGGARLLGYEVTAHATGTLFAPEVTLSSLPPLPDDELVLLVLAGTPPGTADERAMKRILEANLARFAAETLIGTVAGPGEEELADRIEVEVGRDVTQSGGATIETRFRLFGGTAPTGGGLYLTGGTDVYDAYTMGVNVVFRFR